jgi:ribosomal protein S18 acetylase RimI-like enzyme
LKYKETAKQVLKLQLASYKVEAKIIGFYDIPPLKDKIESLIECDEIFYGYMINDVLAGIISYKTIENVIDIHRVAIHPDFFRMGIAGKLVCFVEGVENGINKIVVCTGQKNLPAINLYLKNGYQKIKDIKISKDVCLTKFEKTI